MNLGGENTPRPLTWQLTQMLRDLPVLGQGGPSQCSERGSKVIGVLSGASPTDDKTGARDFGRKERYQVDTERMFRQTDNHFHLFTTLYISILRL